MAILNRANPQIKKIMVQTISRYEKYKPSGIDWIGEVPEHWEVKRLKDVANVTLGKMLQNDDSGADDLKPYLRSFNVQWDRVDIAEVKEMWLSEYEQEQYRLKKYDLVVSEGGEVGRCAVWLDEIEECYIQNSVHKVTCNKRILPYFLLFQFTTAGKAGHFDKIINKVSIGHLTREKLVAVNFVLPPKTEQLAIANYLDGQTQKIDRLIANKKAQAEKLKELRQIEINHAVTKGLNPNAELKDSGIEWLGKIPKHWEVKRLKDISSLQSGESITSEDFADDGEYPVYGGNGLRGYFGSYTHEGNYVLIGRQGALCGNINYASGKFWASEHAVVVSPKKKLDFFWLGELLRNMNLNQYSLASAQPGLSVEKILFLKVPFPPFEEQTEIASYLQQRTTAIDQLTKNIEAQIEKLQELRKIKIYEAVTGKIKVSGYERN